VTLLATKKFLKRAWAWIKNYWYVPALIIYTLVMWIFLRKPSLQFLEVLSTSKEKYEKHIEIIDKTHEEEIKRRDDNLEKYKTIIASLEKHYENKEEELDEKKKKEVKKIIEKHENNIDALAKEISEKYGLGYVE